MGKLVRALGFSRTRPGRQAPRDPLGGQKAKFKKKKTDGADQCRRQ